MKTEMWRLYRHLLFGGVVIVAACYLVMEFIQIRFGTARVEQLLCADAEFSSALLLTNISRQLPESQFSWAVEGTPSLSVEAVSRLIGEKKWLRFPDNSYQLTFGDIDAPVLVGRAVQSDSLFQLEALLKRLLLSEKLSSQDKVALLESMPCLSIKPISPELSDSLTGVALVHGVYSEYGFVWKDDDTNRSLYLSVTHSNTLSLTWIVVVVVGVGIAIMLILIWRELVALDFKRKTFESITRQIARGRSGVPKGIPDSSGTLKELAYSFDSMSSHIQRLLKVQREMINAISHELRTPIARLRFGLEVMKDEVDPIVAKTIEGLEGDVEELNTLVDEVLTYGKLEGGSLALNFKEVSVFQLVNGILQHNHLLLQHLHVEVDIRQDDVAIADEHHLNRALQNLILNAAKYATDKIVVSFSYDAERWQLDIEDDGPGIAFEDRDKVFVPFQRLDNSRTRASGGYGLGLAIVQRIAFWHGGAVLIDASETGGAKFSFIWSRSQHQNTLS
ncbi:two-component sensor histidine kinase [Marinomonas sp. M1K-6]|uniref:histidine kinase n=1 Tax=Marinomonas profundi TaxID=2726122 RepID=A0A847QV40_9GAMM|nr:ATP-binding protein [Marinomonas profundi]NLQ16588.1 two-component sensor histidine kinase [Marinomonas profundi]UDV03827.1 two-component sensor histidine kinase [Marinomonas profundi]